MFAFAVRLRRKKQAEKEVVKKSTSVGVYVGTGFLLLLFGSLFIFLELVGKCGCSGDYVGYAMVTIGSTMVTYYCIKDLIQTIRDEDMDEGVEGTDGDNESIVSSELKYEQGDGTNSKGKNTMFDMYQPALISRDLSPVNEGVKLEVGKDIKIIPCLPRIPSRVLKTTYELPTVVVDT